MKLTEETLERAFSEMSKYKILTVLLLLLSLGVQAQNVKTIEVKPVGVYATIDIDYQNRMMKQLYDPKTRSASVDTIFGNIGHYNPPVLYLFSQALYQGGEKDAAIEWWYFAQLCAMYDAARCADNTAKQGVLILEENIQPLYATYILQNKEVEAKSAAKALELFNHLKPDYDIRWINLHGLGAFSGFFSDEAPKETPKLTEDELLWPKLRAKVVKDFTKLHRLKQ